MPSIAASRIIYLQNRVSRFNDPLAYKELFTSFYPALIQFATGITRSRKSAEEVVSVLFLDIWEKRKTLEEIQNLRVYCFVTARHLSINQLEIQKSRHRGEMQVDHDGHHHPDMNRKESMISTEMLRRIQETVEVLPPRCKLSFKLIKEYGFTYREAAEILQVSEKTIGNQLGIALKKISACICFDISRSIPVIAGLH
jgi:RNA polymerase sigma-70 factor (family 1)